MTEPLLGRSPDLSPKARSGAPGGDRRLFANDEPCVCAVTADVPVAGPLAFLSAAGIKA